MPVDLYECDGFESSVGLRANNASAGGGVPIKEKKFLKKLIY